MSGETVRTTFVLPIETAKKLKEFVPDRKRSEFVAKAIEQYLMSVAYERAIESSFGKWKDEDYPHLRTKEDIENFICELRSDKSWRIDQKKRE